MNQVIKERIEKIKCGEVPEGYKKGKVGIIPCVWKESTIGTVITFYTEKSEIDNQYPILTSSRNGLILQSEYFDDQVTRDDNTGYNVIPYGYITYRSRSDDGTFVFNENNIIEKGIVSCFYPVFSVNPSKSNKYFVKNYLNHFLKRQIVKEIVGTSQLVLSEKKLASLCFPNPPLSEQEKIAEILSLWDKAIMLMENLIEQKKKQKKWLMQNLLDPERGVRLPGFEGEWVEKSLESLCTEIIDGDWIESKDQSDSGIRLIQTGNIGIGAFLDKFERARYINEETFTRLHCTEIFEGDILISRLPDPIGRACVIKSLKERAIAAVDCSIVRFKTKSEAEYFIQYACSEAYFKKVAVLSGGSTRTRISRKEIEKLTIPLPSDTKEQIAISKVLATAGYEIDLLEQKLEQLQKQKKALMQLLLTGIVRVTV